jgi:hypothetical protein
VEVRQSESPEEAKFKTKFAFKISCLTSIKGNYAPPTRAVKLCERLHSQAEENNSSNHRADEGTVELTES